MSFQMEAVFWHGLVSLCNAVLHYLDVAVHFSAIQVSQTDPQPCSEDT